MCDCIVIKLYDKEGKTLVNIPTCWAPAFDQLFQIVHKLVKIYNGSIINRFFELKIPSSFIELKRMK